MSFQFILFIYELFYELFYEFFSMGVFEVVTLFFYTIFAVYHIALCPVRILTGLCFVGTPPPLSVDFDWATSTPAACGSFQLGDYYTHIIYQFEIQIFRIYDPLRELNYSTLLKKYSNFKIACFIPQKPNFKIFPKCTILQ